LDCRAKVSIGSKPCHFRLAEVDPHLLRRLIQDAADYAHTRRLNMRLHRRVQALETWARKHGLGE
jgi:hypothetical protein